MLKRDDKGLDVADFQRTGNVVASKTDDQFGSTGSAEAEIFFDGKGDWDALRSLAMWKMRWKARLRRYHDPGEMLLRTGSQIAIVSFREGLDKAISRKLPALLNKKFNIPLALSGNLWSTWWSSTYIKNGLLHTIGKKTVGSWLATRPPDNRSMIIH